MDSFYGSITSRKLVRSTSGGALLWVLIACAAAVIAFLVITKSAPPKPIEIAVSTPAPATPAPAPQISTATPAPMPKREPVAIAMQTPPPVAPPPILDIATLVRTRSLWPAQVTLQQVRSFPVSINGRIAGEMKVPAGTSLPVLQIGTQQVEVQYQGQRQLVPIAATDLMARATAAFQKSVSALPQSSAASAPHMPVAVVPISAAAPSAVADVPIGDRMVVDVARQKKSRIEGGDYDDKKDHITLKVKISNLDPNLSIDNLRGEIFTLAESILDRTAFKMLAKQNFSFKLLPRGIYEFTTEEAVTAYDTTNARFGYRYGGWLVRIMDGSGKVIAEKSNLATVAKNGAKVAAISAGHDFDRTTFTPKKTN